MKVLILICISLFQISRAICQIDVESIREEILTLDSDSAQYAYWGKIGDIDQTVVVPAIVDGKEYSDSLSYENLIRAALMMEIHGYNSMGYQTHLPLLPYAHHYSAEAHLLYWPHLTRCANNGGSILTFGGKYPYYPLIGVTDQIYNKSMIKMDSLVPILGSLLDTTITSDVSTELAELFLQEKKIKLLLDSIVIGIWGIKQFKFEEDGERYVYIVLKNNGKYYYGNKNDPAGALLKELIVTESNGKRIYRAKLDQFGWYWEIENDGSLTLYESQGKVMRTYQVPNK